MGSPLGHPARLWGENPSPARPKWRGASHKPYVVRNLWSITNPLSLVKKKMAAFRKRFVRAWSVIATPFCDQKTKMSFCTGAEEHAEGRGNRNLFSSELKDAGQKQVDQIVSFRYPFRLIHRAVLAHSSLRIIRVTNKYIYFRNDALEKM